MKDALATTMTTLPGELRRSLTWDRGKELSAHALFTVETGIPVFFADPRSPWQRGTNENTNGLLRQYFPKGTDLSRWSADDIVAVAATLNARPRKTLGWRTPAEDSMSIYAPCSKPVLRPLVEPSNYCSWVFGQRLREAGLLGSMGTVGDALDNAVAESFFASLQCELLDRHRWPSRAGLARAMFTWIETFYNSTRRHSTLGYLSPVDYETAATA